MESKRNTADRIRPFLQQMERSIETARRRRLVGDDAPAQPSPSAPAHQPHASHQPAGDDRSSSSGHSLPSPFTARPQRGGHHQSGGTPPLAASQQDQSGASDEADPNAPQRLKARRKESPAPMFRRQAG